MRFETKESQWGGGQGADPRFYVYLHKTIAGVPFYVGKGTGRRAWSRDRDDMWKHYVSTRLGGEYAVEIVAEGLSEEQALEVEDDWMRKLGNTLLNRQNFHRDFSVDALYRNAALREQITELTRLAEVA